jgi:hypothetical protein
MLKGLFGFTKEEVHLGGILRLIVGQIIGGDSAWSGDLSSAIGSDIGPGSITKCNT